jgi:hypothetical protein
VEAVAVPAHPGHDVPVIEAQGQLASHPDVSVQPHHDPHDVRHLVAGRHEVDDPDGTVVSFPLGFQDEGVPAVATPRAAAPSCRGEEPAAGFGGVQERIEAGWRIEPRQAQPVNRPFSTDQGRRVQIPDHRIILDAYHALTVPQQAPRHEGCPGVA